MYEAALFSRELEHLGSDFIVGVPDTVIKNFCNYIIQNPPAGGHVIAANEGGAIGLAAGHYFASGRIPVVYMQNSGIGNAVNPLLSLADPEVYAVPMLLLVGWRGEPEKKDEPQHRKQGRVSQALFDSMDIPCGVIGPDFEEAKAELKRAYAHMKKNPGPYAILVKTGCFSPFPAAPAGYETPGLKREDAIRIVVQNLGPKTAVVASTGMGSRELYEIREALGQPHERDFLNVGSMGHASMVAAGLAMAQPDRQVVCLDGDGALFMHMGAMALIPSLKKCANLVHILLNNGVHDSVGGQPNLGADVDIEMAARSCGYHTTHRCEEADELRDIIVNVRNGSGPVFVEVRLARGFRENIGRPTLTFKEMSRQFREFLAAP